MSAMRSFLLLVVALAVVIGTLTWIRDPGASSSTPRKQPMLGSVEALSRAYAQWKTLNTESGGDLRVVLPLNWSKGLSSEFTEAKGTAAFDLVGGNLRVEVSDPCGPADLDVWLVDNQPGPRNTVMPEKGDRMVRAGRLEQSESGVALEASIPSEALGDFGLDLVVVTAADRSPDQGGLLYGTPGLFQRLYSREMRIASGDQDRRLNGLMLAVVAPVPQEGPIVYIEPDLSLLIAQGEDLFFNGKFGGNGRTCGTCHDAANNLTIDPPFIAGLPDDDPLFVAEFIPALNSDLNGGKRFEIPTLMREHGLILENLDGFGDLANRFTMRGVPHTLGLNLSLTRPPNGLNPPVERTGWSGDGAPFDNVTLFGGLREFAVGAVTQHFPKTLARQNFQDFVLPTEEELDALEAFQRSTGRQFGEELDIANMQFLNNDVIIGRNIFQDQRGPNVAGAGKCVACHANAGANVAAGTNNNFNTGVEQFLVNHPDGTGLPRPRDGGFGTNPQGNFQTLVANADGSFGDKTFNTPPVVEAADTAPFFHNNITEITAGTGTLPNTIEGAVEFYTRDEFRLSPSGAFLGPIVLTPTQIAQVGKFLRVINALENERNARTLALRARDLLTQSPIEEAAVNRLLTVAIADTEDGIEVLEDVQIHHIAQQRFHQASQKLEGAKSGPANKRIEKIDQSMEKFSQARADMITNELPFM